MGRNSYLGGHSRGTVAPNFTKTSTKRNKTKFDKAGVRKEDSAKAFAKSVAKAIVLGWRIPKAPPHLQKIVGYNVKNWMVSRSDYDALISEAKNLTSSEKSKKEARKRLPKVLMPK